MKEARYGESHVMDYLSTKKGREVRIPNFGDNIKFNELIPPSKKPIKNNDKTLVFRELRKFEKVIQEGYNRTIIFVPNNPFARFSKGTTIELLRIIEPSEVKRLYPRCSTLMYSKVVRGIKDITYSEVWKFSVKR